MHTLNAVISLIEPNWEKYGSSITSDFLGKKMFSSIAPFGLNYTYFLVAMFFSVLGLIAINQTHFPEPGFKWVT